MVVKFVTFFGLVAAASAVLVPHTHQPHYAIAQPKYVVQQQQYAVQQPQHVVQQPQYIVKQPQYAVPQPQYIAQPQYVAQPQHAPAAKLVYAEPETPAQYEFEYSVNDPHTEDVKSAKENRNGDNVQGYYSLVQPDGIQRIVEYTSSKEHGFNAVVRYEGSAKAAAPAKIAYAAAPVAKVAYAPSPVAKVAYSSAPVAYAPAPFAKVAVAPATKIAYAPAPVTYAAAPVAKLAYAPAPAGITYAQQPIAKVAYSPAESVGHVTYASPAVSYQH